MTENKRFTIKEIDNFNYGIKVTDVIMDDGIELPQSTVCDLLNDLSTENDELRQELNCEKPLFTKKRLHQENQQLTDEIQKIKNTIKEAYETERTELGKSVLKQLLNNIEAIQWPNKNLKNIEKYP